jgi:amino acid adenylation domain-containing protein
MPRLLHEWLTAQAHARPDAIAVVSGRDRLTYAGLDRLSTQLARVLRDGGVRRDDRVGLLTTKSPASIIGLLGVYKADASCVPLDPLSPARRLAGILSTCDSEWLLGEGPVAKSVDALADEGWHGSLGWLDTQGTEGDLTVAFSLDDLATEPVTAPAYRNRRSDPAHILFTSGSTGVPKGVVITHDNVISFVEWAVRYFGMQPSDRLSGHTPLHFDISFMDVFGALAVGAELHLVPRELNLLPNKLVSFIRESQLTQWFSAPSILNYLARFDVIFPGDFPSLKRVIWCGEVLPTPALIHWMERLPHARFTNLYGPTETTIASSYYTVPSCPADPKTPIPIGTACEGEELLVLDAARRPVAPGEIGDLYIGGSGLALGYWRDPERTNAAYVPHPDRPGERVYRTGDLARIGPDGLLYFLGRNDSQVKCRGYRIELGEIEAALNAFDSLCECAVVAIRTDGFESVTICCAYVAAGSSVTPLGLKQALTRSLPSYMLPARWLAFDRLPHNASGKVDRPRLIQAFAEQLEQESNAVHTA